MEKIKQSIIEYINDNGNDKFIELIIDVYSDVLKVSTATAKRILLFNIKNQI